MSTMRLEHALAVGILLLLLPVRKCEGGGGSGEVSSGEGGAEAGDRVDEAPGAPEPPAETPSHAYAGPPPPVPPPRHALHTHPHSHHPLGLARIPNRHNMPPPSVHGKPFAIGQVKGEGSGGYRTPPADSQVQASDKSYAGAGAGDVWPAPAPDMPKIVSLDVKCEKNAMRVFISFDKPFYGIVFSKGHYANRQCVHLPPGLGRTSAAFEIGAHACGTAGSAEHGAAAAGTYFENVVVIQYDPQVQEVWDQARKLRCTWHDQYEKSVTFRPFPVDALDVVRADFAGDNVGCWMQIQVGKGPWASEVSGLVKIGQTMTMVLAIKDDDSKFDMLVRNCVAHDGQRSPIQLVDHRGCVTRPKLMSRFTKIKNFGASASVLSYAHFQAFKFPDSMEVHFQCTIQICRYRCPEQCSESDTAVGPPAEYGPPPPLGLEVYGGGGADVRRDDRRVRRTRSTAPGKEVGVNRVIRVVSAGDLTFTDDAVAAPSVAPRPPSPGLVCMTTPGFAATLAALLAALLASCALSATLCLKLRPKTKSIPPPPAHSAPPAPPRIASKSRFYS